MDLFDSNQFPNRKPTPSERFLGVTTHAPPLIQNPISSNDELQEDDVVFFSSEHSHHNVSTSSSSSSSAPNHHCYSHDILAALPEKETSSLNIRNVSHLFHKASISSSSSSRLIPAIPRPRPPALLSSVRYHQSAPVNVPVLSEAMMKARGRHHEFDDNDGEEEEEEEMVPPHEITARNSAQSPMLACSVLEGIGRTLKGSDLRQVRNAVWRQTGRKLDYHRPERFVPRIKIARLATIV